MFRRIEHLIREVRQNTDTLDSNAISDDEIISYFNDGQQNAQALIHLANGGANIFIKSAIIQILSSTSQYDLPYDIYAVNSVTSVNINGNAGTFPLSLVDFKERGSVGGYSVLRDKIILSATQTNRLMQVWYQAKVPTLSKRVSKVTAIDTVANTITVDIANIAVDDFQDLSDYVSTVDKFGNITAQSLYIDSYDLGSATLTLEGDFTEILDLAGESLLAGTSVGDYVTIGRTSTSHSELPRELEPTLLFYVKRRMLAKKASDLVNMVSSFTENEAATASAVFEDNSVDTKSPPVLDADYLNY